MADHPHPDRTASEMEAAESTARILLETEAVLFSFSDRPAQQSLGIWREE